FSTLSTLYPYTTLFRSVLFLPAQRLQGRNRQREAVLTMSTMYEQETTITSTRGDEWVFIYTANPFHIAKLDAEDRAEATSRSTEDRKSTRLNSSHVKTS